MKKLIEQDPNLMKNAGEAGAKGVTQNPEQGGAGDGIDLGDQGKLTFESARQALGSLAQLLKETPESAHAAIRHVGKVFVDAFRHNPRLATLMVTILSDKAVEA